MKVLRTPASCWNKEKFRCYEAKIDMMMVNLDITRPFIYNDMFHLYKTAQQKVCTYNVEYSPLSNPALAGVNEVNEVEYKAGLEEVDDPVNNKYLLQEGILYVGPITMQL